MKRIWNYIPDGVFKTLSGNSAPFRVWLLSSVARFVDAVFLAMSPRRRRDAFFYLPLRYATTHTQPPGASNYTHLRDCGIRRVRQPALINLCARNRRRRRLVRGHVRPEKASRCRHARLKRETISRRCRRSLSRRRTSRAVVTPAETLAFLLKAKRVSA